VWVTAPAQIKTGRKAEAGLNRPERSATDTGSGRDRPMQESMRVLLVKPYQEVPQYTAQPPLGLLYLAADLRERFGSEVDVKLLDMKSMMERPERIGETLRTFEPDVVGVSALNCEAASAHQVARLAKEHNEKTLTVLGGPYSHKRAEELLGRTEFDWTFDGPADRVFPEALSRHFGGDELGTDLPGLSYKHEGGAHFTHEQDSIKDLDALPLPAWDLVDLPRYAPLPNMMNVLKGKRYAPIFTSRGCPYKCNYCHDIFGKRFIHRSADNVLAEIELLHEKYGVDEFEIVDDIFNLHKPRLKKIMSEVQRRWPGKLKFCFPNGVRADIMDESVIEALREGGTYAISIAIETATPRLQTLVEKELQIEKARWAIDECDRKGMMVTGFFMLGFPTETREEIQATVDFALNSRLSLAYFFQVVPQPATPLWDLALQEAGEEPLRAAMHDEEEGSTYRSGQSWYERAYGFPLEKYIRSCYAKFYLRPGRVSRILRRAPTKSLFYGFKRLMAAI
jgi:radical SAM superfamily enzyme YgiQ (UPF0313 family)